MLKGINSVNVSESLFTFVECNFSLSVYWLISPVNRIFFSEVHNPNCMQLDISFQSVHLDPSLLKMEFLPI